MKLIRVVIVPFVILAGCTNDPTNLQEFNDDLRQVLETKPAELGTPTALMKKGPAGADWLATIHGYPNNTGVCEDLIKPYNQSPELSTLPGTYYCEDIKSNQ